MKGARYPLIRFAEGNPLEDFFCAKARLVIEVDGDSHADPKQAGYDAERTEWLNEQKHYRVIRLITQSPICRGKNNDQKLHH